MALRVPDTDSFSLRDVLTAVEDHAGNISNNLEACFNNAVSSYFDPAYDDASYAPANSMKRFRNYGPDCEIFVPDGFSPNGDGINDYFEVQNLDCYPIHEMTIFSPPGGVTIGGTFYPEGTILYQRTNDYDEYPWDGTVNGHDAPETTYVWDLDINESNYDDGTVLISR
ncbi:MAG: gliding motility-associated C-terminal domain-containing protein [bacterium]